MSFVVGLFCIVQLAGCADGGYLPVHDVTSLPVALTDDDPDVRELAAALLADEPGEAATHALVRALDDSEQPWRVRVAAARSLAGRTAADLVVECLSTTITEADEDWRIRAASIEALWCLDEGRELAATLAAHRGPLVLDVARLSVPLGTLEPAALRALAAAAGDPDPRVRRVALLLLAGVSQETRLACRDLVAGVLATRS